MYVFALVMTLWVVAAGPEGVWNPCLYRASRCNGVVGMVSDAGGGGGSGFFAADPAAVSAAGGTLTSEAAAVGAARSYGALAGLIEGVAVEHAAAAFRESWDGPLTQWQTSLTSLGEATRSAATAISGTDAAAASAWQSLGGGMGG